MTFNRRDFLKGGATLGSLAVVGGTALADEGVAPRAKPKKPLQGLRRNCDLPQPNLDPDDYVYVGGKPFTGTVTCDGRPLAGVIVTNGRDSVKTDEKGVYRLPVWKDARFITVTTPSGYRANDHYANAWRLLGGFSFRLEKTAQTAAGKPCRFVHIADSEIHAAAAGGFCKDIKALADRFDCAFIVHTGDICGREGLIAHTQVMNEFTMGRRCVYCAGNHDIVTLWPWGEAEFEGVYGPSWYSFEACGVHFLVMPHVNGDRNPSYDEDQLADWIRGDLALVDPGVPVVLFRHFLPNDGDYANAGLVFGQKRPVDLRKACNYLGCVYGHTHNSWFYRKDGAAMINTANPQMGGIDHSPNCARVITVSEKGLVSDSFYGDMSGMKSERAGAVWETKLPAMVMWGGFLDGGDVLYCATADDDGRETGFICALEKATGAIRWQAKVGNTIKSTLALASGNVIGTDVEGRVWAFAEKDGSPVWMTDLSLACGAYRRAIAHGTTASPDGTRVAVGAGHIQGVLDAVMGKVIWQGCGQGQYQACPVAPAFATDRIITPYNWGPAVCNDAATGKVLWKFGGFNYPGAKPFILGDKVMMTNGDAIHVLDLATGKELLKKSYGGRNVAIPGDIVETETCYLKGMANRGLVALDKKTLEVLWEAKTDPGLVSQKEYSGKDLRALNTTPALVDAKTVCATCADGVIHFWSLADGEEVRRISTGAPYLASAFVSGGRLFAVDMTGMARAFSLV